MIPEGHTIEALQEETSNEEDEIRQCESKAV